MVFSPIPPYLDPSQWQQQQTNHHHQSGASGASSFQLLPHHPSPPPPPPQATHVGGGGGSIRPGSMVDRARMGGLPMPESALKCPRCESTNTKFCYFNNYSLTQPRHFCKTCRRYWTRGGALRSVPVGGGYRRNNKRSKNSSKSPVNSQRQLTADADTSNVETQIASSKLNSPLHHQVSAGDHHNHRMSLNYSNLNNYSAISVPNNGGGDLNYPNFPGFDQIQWRLQLQLQLQQTQQPPLYASTGETSSSYNNNNNNNMNQIQQKMEENGGEVKMGRQFLGVSGNDNHHYWSGFSPSYSHT